MELVDLTTKLKALPKSPGVYLHKNATGEIIYVGKAKVLKNRVKQYFQKHLPDPKTEALAREIADVEWIETDSELDALFLESELIKRYKPSFNILLRDDKSATYIKISGDRLPFVSFTRQPFDDGSEYFGPFYSAYPIKQAMRYLRWIFPYLTRPLEAKSTSRLDWHIGLNPPLATADDQQKYLSDLRQIRRFIRGEKRQIITELRRQMTELAGNQQFKQAAKLRNQIQALEALQRKVRIIDAEQNLSHDQALADLRQLFGLARLPARIEGYDISHHGGTNVVASMVVFINGLAKRTDYRKFKTKIDQNNDFYNMSETIKRRFNQNWPRPDVVLIDGGKGQLQAGIAASDGSLPMFGLAEKQELIVIHKQLSNINLSAVKVAELQGLVFDEGEFYVVKLPHNTAVIKLLQRIRDEAHRFAVGYHTKLKLEAQTISALDQIKGIGPVTRQKLLTKYKSPAGIKRAGFDSVKALIGEVKAQLVWRALD
jgi:excinuclease ABC subunit C